MSYQSPIKVMALEKMRNTGKGDCMSGFKSANAADNMEISEAMDFVNELRAAGVYLGPVYLDATEGVGAVQTNLVPLNQVPEDAKQGMVNCVSVGPTGAWHNLANLKRKLHSGKDIMEGYRMVHAEVYLGLGQDPNVAMMNIDGIGRAIENRLRKIFAKS